MPAYAICPLCAQAHPVAPTPERPKRRRSRVRSMTVRVRDGDRVVVLPVKR